MVECVAQCQSSWNRVHDAAWNELRKFTPNKLWKSKCCRIYVRIVYSYLFSYIFFIRSLIGNTSKPRKNMYTYRPIASEEEPLFIPFIFGEAIIYRFPLGNHIRVRCTNTHTRSLAHIFAYFAAISIRSVLHCTILKVETRIMWMGWMPRCLGNETRTVHTARSVWSLDERNCKRQKQMNTVRHRALQPMQSNCHKLFVGCVRRVRDLSQHFGSGRPLAIDSNGIDGFVCVCGCRPDKPPATCLTVSHLIWHLRNNCTTLASLFAVHLWNDANKDCKICHPLSWNSYRTLQRAFPLLVWRWRQCTGERCIIVEMTALPSQQQTWTSTIILIKFFFALRVRRVCVCYIFCVFIGVKVECQQSSAWCEDAICCCACIVAIASVATRGGA